MLLSAIRTLVVRPCSSAARSAPLASFSTRSLEDVFDEEKKVPPGPADQFKLPEDTPLSVLEGPRPPRNSLVGRVVSDKPDKTIIVRVSATLCPEMQPRNSAAALLYVAPWHGTYFHPLDVSDTPNRRSRG
jgi:hypothetical protein